MPYHGAADAYKIDMVGPQKRKCTTPWIEYEGFEKYAVRLSGKSNCLFSHAKGPGKLSATK